MRSRGFTIAWLVLVPAAVLLGFAGTAAAASSDSSALDPALNDRCFRCHAAPAEGEATSEDGHQGGMYVDRAAYEASRHGKLACTSCHLGFKPGPHDAAQTAGWQVTAKLDACRNCHADVFAMYRSSFHGDLVFGKGSGEAPLCADCHEAHNIVPPDSPRFRASIDAMCARCHGDALETYRNSYHGKAANLGDPDTAVCTDCHGGHRILPKSDPESTISEQNIVATCAQCHPGANRNFAGFMVHIDPTDPGSSFLVWMFYAAYIMLIAVVFTFGAVHTTLYIYRGIKDGLYSRRRSH